MKADDTVSTPLKMKVRAQQGSFTFLRSLGKKCFVSKPGSGTVHTLDTWEALGPYWLDVSFYSNIHGNDLSVYILTSTFQELK